MRRRCFILSANALAGLLLAITPAQSESRSDEAILDPVCEDGQLRDGQCLNALYYPSGESCSLKLTGEQAEGRFLGPKEPPVLLAVYESGCEAHVTNFGGAILFETADGKLDFKGYQPGIVVNDCVTVPGQQDSDRLICKNAWMGQGYLIAGISEVIFNRTQDGKIGANLNELIAAEDSTGARGAYTVECSKQRHFFGFDDLGKGPNASTIAITATYADAELIEQACARPDRNAGLGMAPPSDGEAYLAEDQAKNGRFVYDLTQEKLTAAETK